MYQTYISPMDAIREWLEFVPKNPGETIFSGRLVVKKIIDGIPDIYG